MKKTAVRILCCILCCILFALAVLLTVLTSWYTARYDTSFSGLLFTLMTPMNGVGAGIMNDIIAGVLPTVLGAAAGYIAVLVLCALLRRSRKTGERGKRVFLFAEHTVLWAGVICFAAGAGYVFFRLNVPEYLRNISSQTTIYEDYYIAPEKTEIRGPEQKPNLICLYLESMETTYASREDGGIQPENYMPNLTRLAAENISFSNTGKLGGFLSTDKTNWTMAALFGATSGLPFGFPVGGNSMNKYTAFAPDIVTLGDLLEQDGYTQEFLCGSDASYGGRELYFTEHGKYGIYDLFTARRNGDLPSEDYYVWWGFEDRYLFDIARRELTRLYEAGEPFNLTMLTVDAHHLGGFLCDECRSDYSDKTANVIACTDRQVGTFVDWCRQQPFWENTVMVISGDHPRMDTCLTEGVSYLDRAVYDCILNARTEPEGETAFRTATVLDLFPTTLAAMGYTIEGNRLGLGTNLFSARKTLAEELGYETLNTEIQKYSRYFIEHFAR